MVWVHVTQWDFIWDSSSFKCITKGEGGLGLFYMLHNLFISPPKKLSLPCGFSIRGKWRVSERYNQWTLECRRPISLEGASDALWTVFTNVKRAQSVDLTHFSPVAVYAAFLEGLTSYQRTAPEVSLLSIASCCVEGSWVPVASHVTQHSGYQWPSDSAYRIN